MNASLEEVKEILPRNNKFIMINFVMFGFVILSPWNFITSCLFYFIDLYPEHNISFLIAIPSNIAVIISSLTMYMSFRIIKFTHRILFSLIILIVLFFLLIINNYYLFMLIIFFNNFFTTVISCSIYGIASKIDFQYLRYLINVFYHLLDISIQVLVLMEFI